jgi:hypothetical protein
MFDEHGDFRLVCYFSPGLPCEADAPDDPTARWSPAVDLLWDMIDPAEHYRVMLPTIAGSSTFDNNYADNSFLTGLTGLGYTGAFWSHWREREEIMRRAGEGAAATAEPAEL